LPQGPTEFDFVDYSGSFHSAIVDLSGSARMATIPHDLEDEIERLVRVSVRASRCKPVPDEYLEHGAIIVALQAHDADRASRLSVESRHILVSKRCRENRAAAGNTTGSAGNAGIDATHLATKPTNQASSAGSRDNTREHIAGRGRVMVCGGLERRGVDNHQGVAISRDLVSAARVTRSP
jgi:hypothetical protein